jgi:hypothetical protein
MNPSWLTRFGRWLADLPDALGYIVAVALLGGIVALMLGIEAALCKLRFGTWLDPRPHAYDRLRGPIPMSIWIVTGGGLAYVILQILRSS